jgi:hypothetical protein
LIVIVVLTVAEATARNAIATCLDVSPDSFGVDLDVGWSAVMRPHPETRG